MPPLLRTYVLQKRDMSTQANTTEEEMHLAIHDGKVFGGRAQDTSAGTSAGFVCSVDNLVWQEMEDLFRDIRTEPDESISVSDFLSRLDGYEAHDNGTDRWFGPEANHAMVVRDLAVFLRRRAGSPR